MSEPFDPFGEAVAWVADTGLFIACGRQQNDKYIQLERFARENGITFVIPRRVYDELGGAPERSTPGRTPINSAIEAGWVTVADELDYTNAIVARVMDDVWTYIARSSHLDILPRLKTRESTKWIFRLRVSSGLKYAFAWAVEGRRPVVTKDVLFSACSPVNGAFLPAICGRQRRLAVQPAR